MLSVLIVFYLTLKSCGMLIKVKTTQTSYNDLLTPTYILSLLLSSTTSFPYSILAILAMYFISCWSPSHYYPQNLQETLSWPTKCSSWISSRAFWGLILTMPNTSLPLGRLRMPPRSLKSSSKLPTSLSHLRQTETTWKRLVWRQKGLSSPRGIGRRGWILLWLIRTGQWRTGSLLYGLMKLKSTG